MSRIAFWVALAHGLGIAAALLLVRSPGFEAPRPMSIRLQSESSGVPATVPAPPKAARPQTAPPPPSPTMRDTRPAATVPPPSLAADAAPSREDAAPRPQSMPSSSGSGSNADDRQPMVDASFRGNRVPDYPAISRRLGEQGIVVLRVLITPDGRAAEVQLVKTSGSARLDGAAVETVREWRFMPALKGGRPVPAWYEWRWEFRLNQ